MLATDLEMAQAAIATLKRARAENEAEIERLRAAIRWALGEEPDSNGKWFGETYDEGRARYGWRTNLRKIAGFDVLAYNKEKRTIVHAVEQEAPSKCLYPDCECVMRNGLRECQAR